MASALLERAVRPAPVTSSRGVLERLFTVWFRGIVYNQVWEDPEVDLEAMALEPTHRVVSIASAGCNAISYLTGGPARVDAVDLNPAQLALTRLKIAALAHLPDHEHFFRLFGDASNPSNRQAYERYLRHNLDPDTRAYWDAPLHPGKHRIDLFGENLYTHGLMGSFIGFLHAVCKLHRVDPSLLLRARTLEQQRELFERHMAPVFDSPLVRGLAGTPVILFNLGIPPRQRELLERECNGDLIAAYRERIRRLACDFPFEENPFAWQAFARRYDQEQRRAVPLYLRRENYEQIRPVVDRLRTHHGYMTDFLAAQPDGCIDRYVLLDAQDWMSSAQLAALWHEVNRTARPGARVIFRTIGTESVVEGALPVELLASWRYDEATSRALLARDRSAVYGGFHVYEAA